MITHARMKKFVVDNRIDKDGRPDPIIQLQVEMRFAEHLARELAHMTNGELVVLTMEPQQTEIGYETSTVESTIEDAETCQLSLLEAGEANDDDPLANTETQELIDRYQAIYDWFNDSEIQDVAGKDNKQARELDKEAEAITNELNNNRGLFAQRTDDDVIEWIEKGAAHDDEEAAEARA